MANDSKRKRQLKAARQAQADRRAKQRLNPADEATAVTARASLGIVDSTTEAASDDLVYCYDDVLSDDDEDADDSIDMWAACPDEPPVDLDSSHQVDTIATAASLVPPTTATVASYRKAWGCGPKTLQRMRRSKSLDREAAAELGLKPIYSYFAPESGAVQPSGSMEVTSMTGGFKTVALIMAKEAILSRLKALPNKAKAATVFKDATLYTVQRHTAVHVYFDELLSGKGRMEASMTAAKVLGRSTYPDKSIPVFMPRIETYGARVVRSWAGFYVSNLQLPAIQQGHNVKIKSIIHDEDVQERCRTYLKSTKPDKRSVDNFKTWIHEDLIPTLFDAKRWDLSIPVATGHPKI